MTLFRTYEYCIRPTQEQKKQLTRLLDRQDTNFNKMSRDAEVMIADGRDLAEIEDNIVPLYYDCVFTMEKHDRIKKKVLDAATRYISGYSSKMPRIYYYECRRSIEFREVKVQGASVYIPVLGWVEMVLHRELPTKARIYAATVIEDCYRTKYYISLHLYFEKSDVSVFPVREECVLGLDYKQEGLYVDSNGQCGDYPGFLRKEKERLAQLHHSASRFVVGSSRWLKLQKRAAKLQKHIMNQRKDWQYKKAKALATENDAVCLEHLDFHKMEQENPALHTKIYDNYWQGFRHKLQDNLKMQGKPLIEVSKYYPSSQICSVCGYRFGKIPLSQREITCACCASTIDRDINAARNIRDEGLRMLRAS